MGQETFLSLSKMEEAIENACTIVFTMAFKVVRGSLEGVEGAGVQVWNGLLA